MSDVIILEIKDMKGNCTIDGHADQIILNSFSHGVALSQAMPLPRDVTANATTGGRAAKLGLLGATACIAHEKRPGSGCCRASVVSPRRRRCQPPLLPATRRVAAVGSAANSALASSADATTVGAGAATGVTLPSPFNAG